LVEITRVTGIALDLRVRSFERITGFLVVVEANRIPLLLIMAAFTLSTVPLGVNIL
jgi:hypothetical protein